MKNDTMKDERVTRILLHISSTLVTIDYMSNPIQLVRPVTKNLGI